jgi:hypothetical protein
VTEGQRSGKPFAKGARWWNPQDGDRLVRRLRLGWKMVVGGWSWDGVESVRRTERSRCRPCPFCCGAALALPITLSCVSGPCPFVHIFASSPESAPASDFHYRKSSFTAQCVVILGRHHIALQLDFRPPCPPWIHALSHSLFNHSLFNHSPLNHSQHIPNLPSLAWC